MVNNVCRNVLLEGGWGWGPNPYGKCHVFLVFLDYFPEQFTSGATSTSDGIFFSSEVWSWWRCWRSFQVKVKTSNLTANYQNWTDLTINLNRLVRESGGLEETRSLAKKHATQASDALSRLLARKCSFKKSTFKIFQVRGEWVQECPGEASWSCAQSDEIEERRLRSRLYQDAQTRTAI